MSLTASQYTTPFLIRWLSAWKACDEGFAFKNLRESELLITVVHV